MGIWSYKLIEGKRFRKFIHFSHTKGILEARKIKKVYYIPKNTGVDE